MLGHSCKLAVYKYVCTFDDLFTVQPAGPDQSRQASRQADNRANRTSRQARLSACTAWQQEVCVVDQIRRPPGIELLLVVVYCLASSDRSTLSLSSSSTHTHDICSGHTHDTTGQVAWGAVDLVHQHSRNGDSKFTSGALCDASW